MDRDDLFMIGLVVGAGMLICMPILAVADIIYMFNTTDVMTETGQIVSVTPHLNSDGGIDFLTVLFGNGHSYDVRASYDVDFTMHSSVIVELSYYHHLLPFFGDEFWHIGSFYKVPGGDV